RLALGWNKIVVGDDGVCGHLSEAPLANFIDLRTIGKADDLCAAIPAIPVVGEVVDAVLKVTGVNSDIAGSEVVRVVAIESDTLVAGRHPSISVAQRVNVVGKA